MARILGREITKSEILKRVGDIEQIAQITSIELKEGSSNGVRALDVRNGGGLHFLVLVDRGLDISNTDFWGIPISVRFHPGDVAPYYYEDQPLGFMKVWSGGLMTTCGLLNVGVPDVKEGECLIHHGNFTHIPAKNVQYDGIWNGDQYELKINGKIREVDLYHPNLELRRNITTLLGSNKIMINDEIENIGFKNTSFMILYHCNFGYPLLDKYTELRIDTRKVTLSSVSDNVSEKTWNKFSEPVSNYRDQVFYHDVKPDIDGNCVIGIYNQKVHNGRSLGVNIKYKKGQLPILTQWKMFNEGIYVLSLEPGNCHVEGQAREKDVFKTLQYLKPGEIKQIELEFEFLLRE